MEAVNIPCNLDWLLINDRHAVMEVNKLNYFLKCFWKKQSELKVAIISLFGRKNQYFMLVRCKIQSPLNRLRFHYAFQCCDSIQTFVFVSESIQSHTMIYREFERIGLTNSTV